MARRTNEARIEDIARVVQAQSGLTTNGIANLLGVSAATVMRALPDLEAQGILLAEDDDGYLSFFARR